MNETSVIIFTEEMRFSLYREMNLEADKVKILSCDNVEEKVRSMQADVVIIDQGQMIDKALLLLEIVKSEHPSVPVILLTDSSSEDNVLRAFQLGVREYIRKPANIVKLRQMISLLLKAKQKSKEKKRPYHYGQPVHLKDIRSDASTDKPVNILNAIRFLEENFAQDITLDQCAKEAKLSKYYFSRFFKDCTGLSPIQYLNRVRVMRAKELLPCDGLNILQVSFCVGFRDYSSFLKNFKEYTGTTPRQFMKAAQGLSPRPDWVPLNCYAKKPCCRAILSRNKAKNT